mgnify:CR=1 FL=1
MNQKILAIVAAGVATTAGVANADSVNITFDGISGNLGGTVSVSLYGGLQFGDGSSHKSIWAGQLSHTIDGQATKTYCTELTQWAHGGVYDVVDVADAPNTGPMGQTKAEAIYRLFNATSGGSDIDSANKAEAFQAVIWEIVYDYDGTEAGISTGSGNVRMTGLSSYWFGVFRGIAADAQGNITPTVTAYTNECYQDQLGPVSVPLPGAAAMAGVGLAGIGIRRRRG